MPPTAQDVHHGQRWRDEVTAVTLTVTGVVVRNGTPTDTIAIQFGGIGVTEYISPEDLLATYERLDD